MFLLRLRPDHTVRDAVGRLVWMYAAALFLLLAGLIGTLILTEKTAKALRERSILIGLSAEQELLIQRVFALSTRIEAANGREQDRAALGRAIETLEQNHAVLSAQGALPETAQTLVNKTVPNGLLDRQVLALTTAARSLLEDENAQRSPALLRALSGGVLAGEQAAVTTTLEAASAETLSKMRQVEHVTITLAVGLIVLQFFGVLRPSHLLLRRIFAASDARDRELTAAKVTLDQTNAELHRKNTEIEAEQQRLRTALSNAALLCSEQAAFTYSVSHDLKSPANTLQLLLDELIHGHAKALPDDARTLINHAQDSVTHMSELIEDVLQYSWATDPKEAAKPVDLHRVTDRVIEDLETLINQTDATVTFEPMHVIKAAPRQIEILLTHLVTNALRFQPAGKAPMVHVSSRPGALRDTTVLSVRDNGIGIAAADQNRIFGLFQRLHLRDNYPGTGLGLATCQRIAANHGGKITVISTVGEGSTFEVTLGALMSEDELLVRDRAA